MVFLFLLWFQGVPPFPENLADGPVILVGVSLMHEGSVTLAEYHERVHGASYVVLVLDLRVREDEVMKDVTYIERYLYHNQN